MTQRAQWQISAKLRAKKISALDELNALKNSYIVSYGETAEQGGLELIVQPAKLTEERYEPQTGNSGVDYVLRGGREIVADNEGGFFQVVFEVYLTFSVIDEIYVVPLDDEDYSKQVRFYETSKYLDHVRSYFRYPDDQLELQHFAVVCDNYCIDVACWDAPKVYKKTASELTRANMFR